MPYANSETPTIYGQCIDFLAGRPAFVPDGAQLNARFAAEWPLRFEWANNHWRA